jgi:hypothetical protein
VIHSFYTATLLVNTIILIEASAQNKNMHDQSWMTSV